VNDFLLAVILGVVEGLTEFLPISSTAHLRVVEALLGVDLANAYWKTFSIVIQLGAVLCLPIYFRGRLVGFVRTFPGGARADRRWLRHPLTLTGLAFLATAAPAFLLSAVIGKNLESLTIMGWALLVGGVVMWIVDVIHAARTRAGHDLTERLEQMSVAQALWIGGCQVVAAVFPGTSRSMATITGGEVAGMSRPAALEFSFFLSMPTMAAATLYDLLRSLRSPGGGAVAAMPNDAHAWAVLAVGFVVSFVVAYAVVAWFMGWVRAHGFVPFAVYRILAGAAVLWLATTHPR
jgi:undecaprenyl-diphosphatase